MALFRGNTTNYGEPVGILMLKTSFPRIPGDIGNATTFDFPVRYKVIEQANYESVVNKPDISLVNFFTDAAKELSREGCKAIFTSCGFLAVFQREIQAQLDVPFASSSLMQVKYIYDFMPKKRKIGIVTAYEKKLTQRHFEGVGIENIPKAVIGLEGTYFCDFLMNMPNEFDSERAKNDMIEVTGRLLKQNPDIAALVLECTNMPPFSAELQRVYGLPVYDVVSMINYFTSGFLRNDFRRFI